MRISGRLNRLGLIEWRVEFPKPLHPFWILLHRLVMAGFWLSMAVICIWGG